MHYCKGIYPFYRPNLDDVKNVSDYSPNLEDSHVFTKKEIDFTKYIMNLCIYRSNFHYESIINKVKLRKYLGSRMNKYIYEKDISSFDMFSLKNHNLFIVRLGGKLQKTDKYFEGLDHIIVSDPEDVGLLNNIIGLSEFKGINQTIILFPLLENACNKFEELYSNNKEESIYKSIFQDKIETVIYFSSEDYVYPNSNDDCTGSSLNFGQKHKITRLYYYLAKCGLDESTIYIKHLGWTGLVIKISSDNVNFSDIISEELTLGVIKDIFGYTSEVTVQYKDNSVILIIKF